MARKKLRWEYPPSADLITIEVRDIYQQSTVSGQQSAVTLLRPCQYGYNDQGELVKRLYCTPASPGKNPLFFAPKGDGWSEQTPCTNHKRRKDAGLLVGLKGKGGGYDCPFMSNFGCVPCHRAVAYAWCEWPEEAKKDPEWYKYGHGFECDHKNCDHGNYSPENLEWVTTPENQRRRYKVEEPLKKLAISDISWVRIPLLEQLYQFNQVQLDYFFEHLPMIIAETPGDLNIENINRAIEQAIHDCLRECPQAA